MWNSKTALVCNKSIRYPLPQLAEEIYSVQNPQEACSHENDRKKTELATSDVKGAQGPGILPKVWGKWEVAADFCE